MIKKLALRGVLRDEAEVMVSDKINEIIDVVNVLCATTEALEKQGNTSTLSTSSECEHKEHIEKYGKKVCTLCPKCETLSDVKYNEETNKTFVSTGEKWVDYDKLQAVIKEVYELASNWKNINEFSIITRLNLVSNKLKPYITEE